MLKQGLYEQVINREIGGELNALDPETKYAERAPIDRGEASKVLRAVQGQHQSSAAPALYRNTQRIYRF